MRRTIRDFLIILALTVAVGAPLMVWADPAGASEGTYFFDDLAYPNPNRPDTVRNILTIDTSTIAGQTCTVIVDTINGESVHPENYVTVEGGVPTITVTGTEDGVNGEKQSASTVVMGDSLTIYNHFSYATSVAGDVIITCQYDTTTTSTTTAESSSTTAPPSSTTSSIPSTSTSSTLPPATSTTAPTGSSTTTQPPNTSTTAPGSSTSTTDLTSSTTSSIPPVTTVSTLPMTGVEGAMGLSLAGVSLLLLGWFLLRSVRHG